MAVRPRYEWLWVYGFVQPATGATEWALPPHGNTEAMGQVLAHFAGAVGAGPDKRVILALDRAGWHTSAALRVPEGLHLEFLPAYCPELQPAERLWPPADEGVAKQCFRALADLEYDGVPASDGHAPRYDRARKPTCSAAPGDAVTGDTHGSSLLLGIDRAAALGLDAGVGDGAASVDALAGGVARGGLAHPP